MTIKQLTVTFCVAEEGCLTFKVYMMFVLEVAEITYKDL